MLVVPSNRNDAAIADARRAAAGVPVVVQPPRSRIAPFADHLRVLDLDLILVWHYSMLIPPDVIGIPRHGTVNMHGGLLPEYRGGHVLQWAIANGEQETGVTLHFVDETIDTGPVIGVRRVAISDEDDAATVSAAMHRAGIELLREHWPELVTGTAIGRAQDPGAGRYWPLRTPADGRVRWDEPAVRIRNLVRALVPPWPGATIMVDGREVVVDAVDVVDGAGPPGTVLSVEPGRVVVAAGSNAVALRTLRGEGGEPVDPATLPLAIGMRLTAA